jgi:hypothetical protein
MAGGRDPFSPLYSGTSTPYGDDAGTGARRRIPARAATDKDGPGRLVAETLGKAIGLTVLIEVVSVVTRFKVAVVGAFLLSLAFLVGRRLVALAHPRPQPQPQYQHAADDRVDRPFADMHRIEDRLSWASRDLEHFDQLVTPLLAELADERLRERYGITRASHPERARRYLGDDLWQLVCREPYRCPRGQEPVPAPTPKEMDRWVSQLEQI